MIKKTLFIPIIFSLLLTGCGMVQSLVKSTFPYTTTLTIPAETEINIIHSAVNIATSFDQNFSRSGNNGNNVSEVSMVSAKLQSITPSDFNIGNLSEIKVYMSKDNGSDEVLVASRSDIPTGADNTLTLDIDNSTFLDQLIRERDIRIRMAYKLRKKSTIDVVLHLVLGINAYPAGKK